MKEVDTIYIWPLILSCLLGILIFFGVLKKWQFLVCSVGILFFAIAIYKKPVETAIKEIVAEQKMKKEKEKLEEIKRLKEIDEANPKLTNRLLKKTQALVSVKLIKGDIVEFNGKQNKVEEISEENINLDWKQISKNIKFEDETKLIISYKISINKLSNFYIFYKNDKCFFDLNFQNNDFSRKIKDDDDEVETKFDAVKAKETLEKIYSGASANEICEVASKKIKL
jgi:lipoprotein